MSDLRSPLRQLLASFSWGLVRPDVQAKFRRGLPSDENVLTTEVFFGLEMLPRSFFERVLKAVSGDDPRLRERLDVLRREAERARTHRIPRCSRQT